MEELRDLISKSLKRHPELEYYYFLVNEAENKLYESPDACIGACKSLIEGVSKLIIKKLDKSNQYDEDQIEGFTAIKAFENAMIKLNYYDDNINIDLIKNLVEYFKSVISIRNKRCDFSHGRISPKLEQSDKKMSYFIYQTSVSLVQYMLSIFNDIDLSYLNKIPYDKYEEFNEYLNNDNDIGINYSLALYDQDYEAYEEQLKDYYPDQDEL